MADTYSNTTSIPEKMSGHYDGKSHTKYDDNFDKSSTALNNTPYMKKQNSHEKRGEAIMKKQKKGW